MDARVWDALTDGASFFLQRRYLSFLESVLPSSVQPCYAIVHRDGQPVMALSTQLLSVTQEYLDRASGTVESKNGTGASSLVSASGRRLRGALLRGLFRRVLICGSLYTTGIHGFACVADARNETVPILDEALAQLRHLIRDPHPIGFTVIKDPAENEYDTLSGHGYRRCPSEPEMVLELDPAWRSYEDYLAAARSRYRRAARHLIERCSRADAEVVRLRSRITGEATVPLDSCVDDVDVQLYALYEQVEQRAKIRVSSMPPGFLPGLCAAAGPDGFRCSAMRMGGELVGFVASVKDRDTSFALCAGIDYRALKLAPVYLRLLHAALEDAIGMGCARLSLGRMAYEPKARLGAKPVARWIWMRHRQPLLNAALTPLLKRIPHEPVPERHVFRVE